jgi:hypothetical protein
MASFIKRWQGGPRNPIGGIYGVTRGTHETFLNWSREQQAAFLIMIWRELHDTIRSSQAEWARALLRRYVFGDESKLREHLFSGPDTLLGSDQGVRGFLCVMNDLLWVAHNEEAIRLTDWEWSRKSKHDDNEAISDALGSLEEQLQPTIGFVRTVCTILATFDWRLSSALSVRDEEYSRQASYRGSGGYKEIRRNILVHVRDNANDAIKTFSSRVIDALDYETPEEEN